MTDEPCRSRGKPPGQVHLSDCPRVLVGFAHSPQESDAEERRLLVAPGFEVGRDVALVVEFVDPRHPEVWQ